MRVTALAGGHLDAVLRLCQAEGWETLPADPHRALRALTAPGVVTVAALEGGEVVGFAEMLTDGQIQAYLVGLIVAEPLRGKGYGARLVEEAFIRSGALRVDLLAHEGSEAFYRSFEHREMRGYRIYPSSNDSPNTGS